MKYCRILNQIDNLKHIPVIIFTTSTSEKDFFKAYRSHANCYIEKPMDVNKFIKVISSIKYFWSSIVTLPKNV